MLLPVELSDRKNKKYKILVNGSWVHFGDKRYEHYKTSLLIPTKYHVYAEHHDEIRRDRYLKRAEKIKDKQGNLTYLDPQSPNYWSVRLLW